MASARKSQAAAPSVSAEATAPAVAETPAPPAIVEDGDADCVLRRATGTSHRGLQNVLLNDLAAVLGPFEPGSADIDARAAAAFGLMAAFQPRDGVEGMLAQQAVALNASGMAALRRAAHPGLPPETASRLRRDGAGLLKAAAEMVAAVEARRGGGARQTVRVEHVNVAPGGQAIVGAVTPGVRAA